tara:strand:+ start:147 stop:443 length:297 start_codon:yes stop_codon:yes gene_type:complete
MVAVVVDIHKKLQVAMVCLVDLAVVVMVCLQEDQVDQLLVVVDLVHRQTLDGEDLVEVETLNQEPVILVVEEVLALLETLERQLQPPFLVAQSQHHTE